WVAESSRHLFLRALIRGQLCQPTYYMQSFSTAYSRPAVCGRPASQHLLHRSRSVRLSPVSEALCGECLGYLPQRLALSVQLAHQCDDFRNLLSVGWLSRPTNSGPTSRCNPRSSIYRISYANPLRLADLSRRRALLNQSLHVAPHEHLVPWFAFGQDVDRLLRHSEVLVIARKIFVSV